MTADTPSGAPTINRRVDVPGSNGFAVATTSRTRARISEIAGASEAARSVGSTPLGVFRKSGSPSMRRKRPSPERIRIAYLVSRAIKTGALKRPKRCSKCRSKAERNGVSRLHGHHDDYSKPLEVRWLCHGCHADFHREQRAARKPAPAAPTPTA